jgi:hypothetical protein
VVAELFVQVFERHLGIFHHVVQEGTNNGGRAEADFFHTDTGHLDGVQNIGLTRLAALGLVGLGS